MKAENAPLRGMRRTLRLFAAGLVLAVAVVVGSKGGRAEGFAAGTVTSPAAHEVAARA